MLSEAGEAIPATRPQARHAAAHASTQTRRQQPTVLQLATAEKRRPLPRGRSGSENRRGRVPSDEGKHGRRRNAGEASVATILAIWTNLPPGFSATVGTGKHEGSQNTHACAHTHVCTHGILSKREERTRARTRAAHAVNAPMTRSSIWGPSPELCGVTGTSPGHLSGSTAVAVSGPFLPPIMTTGRWAACSVLGEGRVSGLWGDFRLEGGGTALATSQLPRTP